ncbi:DNA-binding domain-containing protein [Aliikangiella coralliicola]|uniref:DUF2063 domain-containing protein n=1 Tax=Aliikangiella coralliicola TaxID=2592383 RepID=A0A545UAD7_9GAMM|nr:DNA-binding domain-containing protein [Aliikangiella coralliicola]TQV86409.1 DUF2063 domain-containing protein [Aliikangiella coralliicola]
MSELKKLHHSFIDYLFDKESDISDFICDKNGANKNDRLNIYRFAFKKRLRDVIDNDHPVLGQYLGDELFDLLVEKYIVLHPSRHVSLRHYCDDLPQFLSKQAPFSEHPILAEIALFERLLMFAFDASKSERLTIESLQIITPEHWPAIKLRFHPSMQLLNAEWNSVESWQAIKSERSPEPATQQGERYWVIWRNQENLTEYRSLSFPEWSTLQNFLRGSCFSEVCEPLLEWYNEQRAPYQVVDYLRQWFNDKLITKIEA